MVGSQDIMATIDAAVPSMASGYRPIRTLGKGGHARVVLVERCSDPVAGRLAACKIVPRRREATARRELECLTRLQHTKRFPRLYEWQEGPEHLLLFQEYVPGGTLEDWSNEQRARMVRFEGRRKLGQPPRREPQVARLIRGVLEALSACHMEGIIHNDVKTGNVMLRDAGDPDSACLIDFGIADDIRAGSEDEAGSSGGSVQCSFPYVSPERLTRSSPPTVKSDVWSLGVLAHLLLVDWYPFDCAGHEMHALCRNILYKPYVPPRSLSDDARDFLDRALRRDVDLRPTAVALLSGHPWIRDIER
jgi:serine/threonine protein kinase